MHRIADCKRTLQIVLVDQLTKPRKVRPTPSQPCPSLHSILAGLLYLMTSPAQQPRILLRIPIHCPQPMQLSSPLRQMLRTFITKPALEPPLQILQPPPLRRCPPLIELQPFRHIPPHLEPHRLIPICHRIDPRPNLLQQRNRLRPILVTQRSHSSLAPANTLCMIYSMKSYTKIIDVYFAYTKSRACPAALTASGTA